jgi:hypothetical protein
MPENYTPATQSDSGAEPAEFNFVKSTTETPRIKRRSLKAKPEGLTKASGGTTPRAARKLIREAAPRPAEEAPSAKPQPEPAKAPVAAKPQPAVQAKAIQAPAAAPRTNPAPTTADAQPASSNAVPKAAVSPHGTRPATLYYRSSTSNDKEAPAPMKTIPTPSPASSSSSATTVPTSVTRPAAASARPATSVDYRANVERQSREQKSVGSILSYVVWGLIGFFVISAGLAIYGADVIFKQLHDQSVTVSGVDQKYEVATKDLTAQLASTQEALTLSQAEVARQKDLILKQEEELNKLIAAVNDNSTAIRAEKSARVQETANLRARLRDVESTRGTTTQKY